MDPDPRVLRADRARAARRAAAARRRDASRQQRVGTIPIEIRLGDGTPYPQRGVVDYVDPTIDPTRGTVTVRAIVPNPNGVLKPGEFVRAIAVFPDRSDAVLVPERAVLEEQGGTYVLVVKPDDVVESRRVRSWRRCTTACGRSPKASAPASA